MESTFKKKVDIVDHGNGCLDIKYKSFRFGIGIRFVLFILIAVLGFLIAGLFANKNTSMIILALIAEVILFKLAYKTTHTINVTNEGVLWSSGRKRLAFKDINDIFTTKNRSGNSNSVNFSVQGTTVVLASELEDQATANLIFDLIIKKMNSSN